MRLVILLVCASCEGYVPSALRADPAGVLGLDLTQRYRVTEELCDTGYDSDGCTDAMSNNFDVALETGSAVALDRVDIHTDTFDLRGVAAGTSTIVLTGDDVTQTLEVAVAAVDTTTMFAQRTPPDGGLGLPDVATSPMQIFTGTTVAIGQKSIAADRTPLVGAGALELAKGTTEVARESNCFCYLIQCDCFTTGTVRGAAELVAPRGTLELEVVDATAIASFTKDDSPGITLEIGRDAAPSQVFLTPSDASGRPIVGRGPTPTLTIDDPTIASAVFDETITFGRALFVRGHSVGTTAFRLTWGTAQLELAVSVVP